MTALSLPRTRMPFWLMFWGAVGAWLVAWFAEAPLADWLAFTALGLERGSHLGEAVAFFLLDVPKVLLLLLGIITVVTLIRGFFPPERVRAALAGRGRLTGTAAAASFGIVTPVLLLLRRAALHRLRGGRHPARRHLRLPHQLADGQRGRAGPAVGPVRTRHRARLHGRRADRGDGRRARHRQAAHGALRRGLRLGPAGQGRGGDRDPSHLGRPHPRCVGVHQGPRAAHPALRADRHRHRRADPRLCARRTSWPPSAAAPTHSPSRSSC